MGRYATPAASRRRPALVEIERHVIVGHRIEYQEQVRLASIDLDAAIGYLRMARCPELAGVTDEASRVLIDARARLDVLIALLRAEAGELDGLCETAELGHGRAA